MDEEPTESTISDQPRHQLTALCSSLSPLPITSHARFPAVEGHTTEGRSCMRLLNLAR